MPDANLRDTAPRDRAGIIAGAINTYTAGLELPTAPERVNELARFIENHLAPERQTVIVAPEHERVIASDEQLHGVLRSTVEFLHAQGCGEACAAVQEALSRLKRPSPLKWEVQDPDGNPWQVTLVDPVLCYARIERK